MHFVDGRSGLFKEINLNGGEINAFPYLVKKTALNSASEKKNPRKSDIPQMCVCRVTEYSIGNNEVMETEQ